MAKTRIFSQGTVAILDTLKQQRTIVIRGDET
ncbi:unnamed protein product, partial [Rotaria sp. Silwood1]